MLKLKSDIEKNLREKKDEGVVPLENLSFSEVNDLEALLAKMGTSLENIVSKHDTSR